MKALPLLVLLALPVTAAPPDDAQRVMDAHQKEANKLALATAQKLDAIRGKYIASGDTKNADEVSKLIKALETSKPVTTSADDPNAELSRIVGKWRRDHDGMLWTFKDTKSGTGGETDFTMSYDPKKKAISIIGPDAVTYIKFTQDDNVLKGENRKGEPFTLRRVK